jgi:hypothetical protein
MGVTLLSWFFLTYVVVGLTNVNLHCHAPVLFSITGILPHLPRLAVVVCTGPLLSLARSLSLSLSSLSKLILPYYYGTANRLPAASLVNARRSSHPAASAHFMLCKLPLVSKPLRARLTAHLPSINGQLQASSIKCKVKAHGGGLLKNKGPYRVKLMWVGFWRIRAL